MIHTRFTWSPIFGLQFTPITVVTKKRKTLESKTTFLKSLRYTPKG